ncbi:MAG: class I SAM-dependent methyltransferase [Bauldia sp.]|nr:class I SAM-dependent methyltransferase [Bauldia sp.]
MSLFPLDRLLNRLVTHGKLTIQDAAGTRHVFGSAATGPEVELRFHDGNLVRRFMRSPGVVIGEAYMDGSYTIEHGTLREFLEIVVASSRGKEPKGLLARLLRGAESFRRNGAERASKNVRHHYDIDHALYELFLDRDMQYSCAYWRDGVTSLEEAQIDKKRHIAGKLLLKPGMKVLDIGSGWGGMALHLAREHGVEVTGVTLSVDQFETSKRRAAEAGLSDRVTFKLQDYRDEPAAYDRIVSVGMFEHVGQRNFAEYFANLDRLLKPDGVALVHTIGRMGPPAPNNAWMNKYIFPGSYIPSLSQLAPVFEQQGLWLTDFETLRVHYAKTLEAWNERFQVHRADIAKRFDERFCRMWEFYLELCAAAFRYRTLVVFQMQIAKTIDAVPITRDYMYAGVHAEQDAGTPRRRGRIAAVVNEHADETADPGRPQRRASS